jgi:hypothetical protein
MMKVRTVPPHVLLMSALFIPALCLPVSTAEAVFTAGANMQIDFNPEFDVPYSGFVGVYIFSEDLIHDPAAGPFFKNFESPIDDTDLPILLDAGQPFPQPIFESFFLAPAVSPVLAEPVANWHESIVTAGWEWVLPGAPRFPNLFPTDTSLITKNGDPHPWTIPSLPKMHEPDQLWVEFPPIEAGNTLGINKALLWVGTPGNTIWGDHTDDLGVVETYEASVRVFEYPAPEPSSGTLLAAAACVVLGWRKYVLS